MTRVAEGPVISYCSSCYGQYPDLRHIDFEAAYDGPVIDAENNIKVSVDDLVICETCLVGAAQLLGWVEDEAMKDENLELGWLIEEQKKELAARDKVISDLKHTIDTMLDTPMKRGTGRPALRLPEGAVRA